MTQATRESTKFTGSNDILPNKPFDGKKTDSDEFARFHQLLMLNAPLGFEPYYFPLEKNGKEPLPGVSWKKNRVNFTAAVNWLDRGHNIGIAGTDLDCLCILDVDDLTQVPIGEIKPTLSVISRKRLGRHFYYFSPDLSAKKNIATHDAGELRSNWQYVLAPGSYVPCGEKELSRLTEEQCFYAGRYTILSGVGAVDIAFGELPSVYRCRHYEQIHAEAEAKNREKQRRDNPQILTFMSKLWDLTIEEVSGLGNTGYRKVPMPPAIHGSETGHNCSVSQGLLHCWRHNVAHNALSYLAVLAGVATCEQAGKPHGGGSFGIDFRNGYIIYNCWLYAKQHGLIPEDDPIPHSALVFYALSRGVIKSKDELIEGRLEDYRYLVTLTVAKAEGINFGRN